MMKTYEESVKLLQADIVHDFKSVCEELNSNPVDLMAYVVYKVSGLPSNQVIGSGTVLDTARLRYILSDYLNIFGENLLLKDIFYSLLLNHELDFLIQNILNNQLMNNLSINLHFLF